MIATAVHPLQLVEGPLPETAHDFRVDLVATPERCLETAAQYRPPGLLWDHLDDAQIAAIPVLAGRGPSRTGDGSWGTFDQSALL